MRATMMGSSEPSKARKPAARKLGTNGVYYDESFKPVAKFWSRPQETSIRFQRP